MRFQVKMKILVIIYLHYLIHACSSKQIMVSTGMENKDHINCGNITSPCKNLSYAIGHRASDNDTILLYPGTSGKFVYTVHAPIDVPVNLTIKGTHRALVILTYATPMNLTDVVFRVLSKRITLDDITIQNFAILFDIRRDETQVTLRRCTLQSFLTTFLQNARRHSLTIINCYLYNFNHACRHTHQSRLVVENSSFVGCASKSLAQRTFSNISVTLRQIGIHIPYAKTVDIKTSTFRNTSYAIKLGRSSWGFSVKITNCSFSNNYFRHWQKGVVVNDVVSPIRISGAGNVNIANSIFSNNVAVTGGALYLSHNIDWQGQARFIDGIPLFVTIDNSKFINNTASNEGGALFASTILSGRMVVKNCLFVNNAVNPKVVGDFVKIASADLGRGGAVNLNQVLVSMDNTNFINNSAPSFGGTIYYEQKESEMKDSRKVSTISNSIINGSHHKLSFFGSALYVSGDLGFENVIVNAIATHGLHSVLYYEKKDLASTQPKINDLRVNCPPNNKVATTKHKASEQYYLLVYICVPCEKGSYSLQYEYEVLQLHKNVTKYTMECYACPTGGTCDADIVSRDNFWGYVDTRRRVHFIPCPEMYCCSQYGEECTTYNSCAQNREGILCGKCRTGFTADVLSASCVPNEWCDTKLFWMTYVLVLFAYTAFIVFYTDIANLVKNIQPSIPYSLQDMLGYGSERPSIPTAGDTAALDASTTQNDSSQGLPSGILSVVVLFYQVEHILKVKTTTKMHYKVSWLWTDFVSSIFNFKPSMTVEHHFCAWRDMDAVGKECLKLTMICCIFFLLLIVYMLAIFWKKYDQANLQRIPRVNLRTKEEKEFVDSRNKPNDSNHLVVECISFQLRIKCAFLRLLLLTYIPVVTITLKLLHCVNIEGGRHLFINGSVQCFTFWQYAVAVFLVIWIAPFCASLYTAINLLKHDKISSQEFFWTLACPPLAIHYSFRVYYSKPASESGATLTCDDELTERAHLLMVLSEPYRSVTEKWVGVVVFRKFCLCFTSVMVVNPVVRLYTMLLLIVLFLLDHIRVQPYKYSILNWMETICLALLLLTSSINLFWAQSFISDITHMSMLRNVGEVFLYLELVLLLGLPALLLCCLIVVCFTYVFHVIIRYFSKKG